MADADLVSAFVHYVLGGFLTLAGWTVGASVFRRVVFK